MQCPYSTLGLTRGASTDEIKKAYKKLVLQHHPDRHASAGEAEVTRALAKFRAIKEAYEVLSDDCKRSAFEAGRSTGAYGSSSGGYSSYSYRAGYGAGYGSSQYNTDWAKGYYQHNQTPNSRLSPWQLWRRRVYAAVMANNASLHLGLAGILLGGLFVGDVVHRAIWDIKNSGKHFKDLQQQQQQVGLGAARSMSTWRSPEPKGGGSSSSGSSNKDAGSSSSSSGTAGMEASPGHNSGSSDGSSNGGGSSSERSSSSVVDAGSTGSAAASEEGQPRQLRPGPYANMRGMAVQPDATGDL